MPPLLLQYCYEYCYDYEQLRGAMAAAATILDGAATAAAADRKLLSTRQIDALHG